MDDFVEPNAETTGPVADLAASEAPETPVEATPDPTVPDPSGSPSESGTEAGSEPTAPAAEPAQAAAPAPAAPAAPPVTVDQMTCRSDDDVLEGHLALVVDGEHAGQRGTFLQAVTRDQAGYPDLVLVRFKDATYEKAYAAVPYSSLRPAPHPGSQ